MNRLHRWYCRSDHWSRVAGDRLLPWTVDRIALGEQLLELGCGPGRVTPGFAARVRRVTSIDIDHHALDLLRRRTPGAVAVAGSAVQLPFSDASFSSVAACTMLHHVADRRQQERLLVEAWRVLQPGGWFVGCDPLDSLVMRVFHVGDTFLPIPPDRLASTLRHIGFGGVDVMTRGSYLRWRARRP